MMPLTTRGRYAARIMAYLARQEGNGPISKQDIGEHEDISPNYVEQLMIGLRAARLVCSHRGRNGGFSLARPAGSITLADVLTAVEGPVCPVPCLYGSCDREQSCPTRPVWRKAAEAVQDVFTATTIAELAEHTAGQADRGVTDSAPEDGAPERENPT